MTIRILDIQPRRGRPPIHDDDESRKAAVAAARAKSRAKMRTVNVDADVVAILQELQEELQSEFGFRPSMSQTLRWVMKERRKAKP